MTRGNQQHQQPTLSGESESNETDDTAALVGFVERYLTAKETTGERYFAYIPASLSFGVRQGQLTRNLALTTAAKEDLPEEHRQEREHAQDDLRYKDLATTQQASQHIDAEERRAQLDAHLEVAE